MPRFQIPHLRERVHLSNIARSGAHGLMSGRREEQGAEITLHRVTNTKTS